MRVLLLAAVVFFVIAAISAFSAGIHANEIGFIALGLAAWAGDQLVGASATWRLPTGGRRVRRPF
ncbi:MAG TPA: hypothetical protein VHT75_11665 [Acidimicrobiales bacterium]|jgi:hypothetical protein|nr:hypothetical protein [Acidimicrobiales bacterium]